MVPNLRRNINLVQPARTQSGSLCVIVIPYCAVQETLEFLHDHFLESNAEGEHVALLGVSHLLPYWSGSSFDGVVVGVGGPEEEYVPVETAEDSDFSDVDEDVIHKRAKD